MDSILNWEGILDKPVQMCFISLPLQSHAASAMRNLCSVAVMSFSAMHADIKGCHYLSRPGICAEIQFIFSCLSSSKTYSAEIAI